jgi:RNA polymerase sigma-70 factor, ECF subfamily
VDTTSTPVGDQLAGPVGTTEDRRALEAELEQYRRELTGYCYRMLGSGFEAEDAVQEAMVRAWRSLDRFEGRSSLRSWLYSIATNVCFDALNGRQRRARPVDLDDPGVPDPATLGAPLVESAWIEPVPGNRVLPAHGEDPAELAAEHESVRLAFVAALHHLPARQRAVLILREVLRWKAQEVADLLDTSVASVNSALQRARATLADYDPAETATVASMDDGQRELLDRYVAAFEAYDIDAVVSLLHEDATLSMPPFALWLRGPENIGAWHVAPGPDKCRGSRLVATEANGMPAFGQYRPSGADGGFTPWALQVIEIVDDRIVGLNAFLDTERLFPAFGLPPTLD